MRASVIFVGLLLAVLFLSVTIRESLVKCDPSMPKFPLKGVDVEGAHIVSAGAYFRFWVFNSNNFSLNVALDIKNSSGFFTELDNWVIQPNSSIQYDAVAPQVSGIYQQVTYYFFFTNTLFDELDYTVLVLNPVFVQIFPLLIPILIIIVAVIIIAVAIVTVRRRRTKTKPRNQQPVS